MTDKFTRNPEAKCSNCPFWEVSVDVDWGQCKGAPPALSSVYDGKTTKRYLRKSTFGFQIPQADWPVTEKNDYCGQHPSILLQVKEIKEGQGPTDRLKVIQDE